MSGDQKAENSSNIDELYEEAGQWELNTGDKTIHAKRIPGMWRKVKWWSAATWLILFLGPYLRLGDRQAVLFDIPERKFHIFSLTILPQDFWMLSMLLLFFAILLAMVTATIGRAYCGYFCFQTVWTDVFTWIEAKLEGSPQARRKMDDAPWGLKKIIIKVVKHFIWLIIGLLTGISFVAWFTDAYQLWNEIITLQLSGVALTTIIMFTLGTYLLAGTLREQVCFWLCPYARLQGVMVDKTTAIPTYDFNRGEPRGRMKKSDAGEERTMGDCVDCNQCIAVCPTGVDIRHGSEEGCIMCGLCIDACDNVMERVDLPKGLIRYASWDELNGIQNPPVYKRPRIWVYGAILLIALSGVLFGITSLDAIELKVLHSRLPLYVVKSDGSIRNKYTLKILNKTTSDMQVKVSATGYEGLELMGAEKPVDAPQGGITSQTVFVSVQRKDVTEESSPIIFHIEGADKEGVAYSNSRKSVFIGPAR